MKTCTFCKAPTEPSVSTFTVDLGNCVVVIRNVPSDVCTQCGEPYYSTEVMQKLYEIVDSLRSTMTEVAIVNYPNAA
ncbi:MAG: type II toxin-antitoxin system MqsA family antitoxin [Selenomonas sp.]|jgi:YgiT-type zinc finger domain-containing protein|uniref:type II toxin-antitoxin system MqsA family antitoxin n=1 Tax=uncultured Selenomonas sp. TaxID=159275 RepID=UPI0025D954D7|nr:type II toxin-antitoxin system MqsA family antitoxin [uncultured Selenomonas sp.]MDY6349622.1 type II toxin-antitoxin system MqsA family antitoxin [Selenomonas sp.]